MATKERKKFNTAEKGHGEKQARGGGREPLQCWICGKDHRKRDCPQYHNGGISQIYSAQEVHTVLMLVISFLGSMQLWTIGRQIIMHRSLRWIVSFVIKLFLF